MNPDPIATPGGAADEGGPASQPDASAPEPELHPARELSAHLLRMLETRMEAAGIALQGETQLLVARLQLKMLAAAAFFFAVWGGIVLLAVALPEHLRVPVLGAVVVALALVALIAWLVARRKSSTREVGSMRWFLDGLRQDLEVLSRVLSRQPLQTRPPDRSPPHDIAA